jgi:hypothetical protein
VYKGVKNNLTPHMKIKGWYKARESRFSTMWFKRGGIIGGINNNTVYPFIAVVFEGDGWNVRIVRYTSASKLAIKRTRVEAEEFAVSYMRRYPHG